MPFLTPKNYSFFKNFRRCGLGLGLGVGFKFRNHFKNWFSNWLPSNSNQNWYFNNLHNLDNDEINNLKTEIQQLKEQVVKLENLLVNKLKNN